MPSLDLCAPHLIKDAGKILREIEKLECEESLSEFVKHAWRTIEPTPFLPNWHIDALCEHLEAVNNGEIKRLLINVPPRSGKTTITSVCWPAWTWAQGDRTPWKGPHVKFLCGSYGHSLSLQTSLDTRRLISSPWYQDLWGDSYSLTSDQNAKVRYDTTAGGYRIATSVGGTLLGVGGQIIIIDDPHNTQDAESEAERESVIRFVRELSTRLNDPKQSAIVCVMQRLHELDASGHMLAEWGNECVHLMIPMEYEPRRHCVTRLGWEDPRKEDGELMQPQRWGPKEVSSLKNDLGDYMAAGRLQQSPIPAGGGIFKREWWQIWPPDDWPETALPMRNGAVIYPDMEYVIASLDTAMTEKEENDWSACTVWGVWRDDKDRPKLMLIAAWQDRLEFRPLIEKVIETCRNRRVDKLLIEAKANGISVGQEITRLCAGEEFGVMLNPVKGDKVARAYSVQHIFSSGMVYAPDKRWADMVIDQMSVFPKGSHDDLVDSCVQAVKHLRDRGLAQFNDEREAELRSRFGPPGERKRLPYDV